MVTSLSPVPPTLPPPPTPLPIKALFDGEAGKASAGVSMKTDAGRSSRIPLAVEHILRVISLTEVDFLTYGNRKKKKNTGKRICNMRIIMNESNTNRIYAAVVCKLRIESLIFFYLTDISFTTKQSCKGKT